MRKILAALLLVASAACRTAAPGGGTAGGPTAPGAPGAVDAAAAVDGFLGAARTGDTRAMARLFGTAAGPLSARQAPDDVEKRMRALQCYLTHDRMRVLGSAGATGTGQVLLVELRQRELVRQTRFTVVPGPERRWFVESFEINTLSDFCRP